MLDVSDLPDGKFYHEVFDFRWFIFFQPEDQESFTQQNHSFHTMGIPASICETYDKELADFLVDTLNKLMGNR